MKTEVELWELTKSTIKDGGLSLIVANGSGASVKNFLLQKGIDAEIIELIDNGFGRAASLKTAFELAKGEYIFLLEGNPHENIGQLPRFLEEMIVKDADVVIGSKRHPESVVNYPKRRRLASWAYYTFVRAFIGLKVTDTQTGVKLFRRATLGYALERMLEKSGAFDLEILTIAAGYGARICEAPVIIGKESHFNGISKSDAKSMFWDTLAVFYRSRFLNYYKKALVPKKLDHNPLVSIVIACPERSWMLDECLTAIERQTYRNFEVIVLDDAKTGKVRPAEKRNQGIKEAKGEIIAFIDDDAYPDERWLECAIKYFGEPSIGAVGGPGVTPPGDRKLAQIGGRVYENPLLSGNYRYRYKAGGVRMDVEDYPSCNLFVRRDLLEKIGGYRTDFWPGEDTLLCKDIIDNWQRIIYEPWTIVYHHRRPLFMPHLRQLGRYAFHRGYFCKRYPSNSLRLSYFIPTAFVCGLLLIPWLWPFYALYALLVAVTSFSLRIDVWLLTALGVFCSHVWYGIRFAQGICAKKAPCEYIGADHGSAKASK